MLLCVLLLLYRIPSAPGQWQLGDLADEPCSLKLSKAGPSDPRAENASFLAFTSGNFVQSCEQAGFTALRLSSGSALPTGGGGWGPSAGPGAHPAAVCALGCVSACVWWVTAVCLLTLLP